MTQETQDADCATRQLLDNISRKWTTLILSALARKPHRFGELRQQVDGISQKVLTQILRTLERDGLVERTVNPNTIPITVTYSLTELGKTLSGPINAIRQWSEAHIGKVTTAQNRYDHKRKD